MLFLLLTLFTPAVEDTPKGIDKAKLKKLQGTWQLSSSELGGKKADPKEVANVTLNIDDKKAVSREGVDVKEESEITLLDPTAKPAAIDMKITAGDDKDQVVKGIWKLDGDSLTICVAEPGKDRPKEFAAKEGTGHTLLGFKRMKK